MNSHYKQWELASMFPEHSESIRKMRVFDVICIPTSLGKSVWYQLSWDLVVAVPPMTPHGRRRTKPSNRA